MSKMKIMKRIALSTILALYTTSAFAAENNPSRASYYEDEGILLMKMRAFYPVVSSTPKSFSSATNSDSKIGSLVSKGYGGEVAVSYGFSDRLTAELSAGVGLLRVKKATITAVGSAVSKNAAAVGKNNDIQIVPLSALLQYQIAPFGAIRPYVGAGYSGTYMNTNSKSMKLSSGHGPVIQTGIDFMFKDDTMICFDIKKQFMKSNVTFKKEFLSPTSRFNDVGSKVSWDPLIISVGIGFKF